MRRKFIKVIFENNVYIKQYHSCHGSFTILGPRPEIMLNCSVGISCTCCGWTGGRFVSQNLLAPGTCAFARAAFCTILCRCTEIAFALAASSLLMCCRVMPFAAAAEWPFDLRLYSQHCSRPANIWDITDDPLNDICLQLPNIGDEATLSKYQGPYRDRTLASQHSQDDTN